MTPTAILIAVGPSAEPAANGGFFVARTIAPSNLPGTRRTPTHRTRASAAIRTQWLKRLLRGGQREIAALLRRVDPQEISQGSEGQLKCDKARDR